MSEINRQKIWTEEEDLWNETEDASDWFVWRYPVMNRACLFSQPELSFPEGKGLLTNSHTVSVSS